MQEGYEDAPKVLPGNICDSETVGRAKLRHMFFN